MNKCENIIDAISESKASSLFGDTRSENGFVVLAMIEGVSRFKCNQCMKRHTPVW